MKANTKNVYVLTPNGFYIADTVNGDMRAGKREGRTADFVAGSPIAKELKDAIPADVAVIDALCARVLSQGGRCMTIFRLYRRFKRWQDVILTVTVLLTVIAAYGAVQQGDEAAARVEVRASR